MGTDALARLIPIRLRLYTTRGNDVCCPFYMANMAP